MLGPTLARHTLKRAVAKMGFTDRAGQPLYFTLHDFRRMFSLSRPPQPSAARAAARRSPRRPRLHALLHRPLTPVGEGRC